MKQHIKRAHAETEFIYTRDLCALGTDFIGEMWKHKLNKHAKDAYEYNNLDEHAENNINFNLLAEQNINLIGEVNSIKKCFQETFEQMNYDFEDIIKGLKDDARKQNIEVLKAQSSLQEKVEPKNERQPGVSPKVTSPPTSSLPPSALASPPNSKFQFQAKN